MDSQTRVPAPPGPVPASSRFVRHWSPRCGISWAIAAARSATVCCSGRLNQRTCSPRRARARKTFGYKIAPGATPSRHPDRRALRPATIRPSRVVPAVSLTRHLADHTISVKNCCNAGAADYAPPRQPIPVLSPCRWYTGDIEFPQQSPSQNSIAQPGVIKAGLSGGDAYAGLSWGVSVIQNLFRPGDFIFAQGSLGGAYQDGYTGPAPRGRKKLGSPAARPGRGGAERHLCCSLIISPRIEIDGNPKVTNGFAPQQDVVLFDYPGIGKSSNYTAQAPQLQTKVNEKTTPRR